MIYRYALMMLVVATTTTTISIPSGYRGIGFGADAAPTGEVSGGVPRGSSSSVFWTGGDGYDLGTVPSTSSSSTDNSLLTLIQQDPNEVKAAAGQALRSLLQEHAGFSGQESIQPIDAQPIRVDKQKRAHIRYRQYVDGLPLEGATLAIHVDTRTGQVLAANGNVHSLDDLATSNDSAAIDCESAMEMALMEHLTQHNVSNPVDVHGEWKDECQLAAVQGRDGKPYLAYKRTYGFQPPPTQTLIGTTEGSNGTSTSSSTWAVETLPPRVDLLFADRVTGSLVAVHPKIMGSRAMATYNCNSLQLPNPLFCTLVSNSPNKISTGDVPVDLAHNHMVDVYDFYVEQFHRHSFDDKDLEITTLTHYGSGYNNAFFSSNSGNVFAFGDGDNVQYGNWAQFDVVAHEFSHGVTSFTSNLVYSYESGAMNEAFSDCMAAAADRLQKGKSTEDVWRVAEDVTLTTIEGIRNMGDPPMFNDPDHYANRYTDSDDQGGVHTNSGIMNKAFYLMVQGGTHPLSGVVVSPLSTDFDTSMKAAATIFYNANTMCLTESSDFLAMRECTLLFASSSQKTTVQAAWDAVGVKGFLSLTTGAKLTGITLPLDHDAQVFVLDQAVSVGQTVTCNLTGTSGDPDLYVRFGQAPNLYPNYDTGNDCYSASEGTVEGCTTGEPTAANTKVYVAVEAYAASDNMELLCSIEGSSVPSPPAGAPTRAPTSPSTRFPSTPTSPSTRFPTRAPAVAPTRTPTSLSTRFPSTPTSPSTRFPTGAPVAAPPPHTTTCHVRGASCTNKRQCCNPTQSTCDGFTSSTRVCKVCKAKAASCTRRTQCCGTLTCDGTASWNKVCKACRARQAKCTRSTQCCAGFKCAGGRCVERT